MLLVSSLRTCLKFFTPLLILCLMSTASLAADYKQWVWTIGDGVEYPSREAAEAALHAKGGKFALHTIPNVVENTTNRVVYEYTAPLTDPIVLSEWIYKYWYADEWVATEQEAIQQMLEGERNEHCPVPAIQSETGWWTTDNGDLLGLPHFQQNNYVLDNYGYGANPEPHCFEIEGSAAIQRDRKVDCPEYYRPNETLGKCTHGDSSFIQGKPLVCVDTRGNPCEVSTGAKLETETDYSAGWASLTRYYHSMSDAGHPRLGRGWRHSYSARVIINYVFKGLVKADGTHEAYKESPTVNSLLVSRMDPDRLIRKIDGEYVLFKPGGGKEIYAGNGWLARIEPANGPVQHIEHDSFGRVVRVYDDLGRELVFVYPSANGNLEKVVLPDGGEIRYSYDGANNLVRVDYPDGSARQYLYEDPAFPNHLTGIIDGNGDRYATYAYDDWGRTVLSEHAGGTEKYTFSYNPDGSTTVTDAAGKVEQYDFTTDYRFFRKPTSIDTGSGVQTFTYATDGGWRKPLTRSDENGVVTEYSYEGHHRVTETRAAGTAVAQSITTERDTSTHRVTKITEPGRVTDYTYDSNGNRLSATVTDSATGESRTTHWTYNQYGQVLSEDGPRTDVSDVTSYEYDALGNLIRITNPLGQVTEITDHDPHGNPLRIVDPNGVVTELAYDLRQRLIRRTVAVGLAEEATTSFAYDPAGQLTRVTLPDGAYITYEYDAAHRLTAMEDALGNRIEYTLDAMGNRVKEEVFGPAGALIRRQEREYNQLNRLVADINGVGDRTAYAYDAVGNRTGVTDPAGNPTAYTYDALDRLTKITDALGGVTRYAYDPLDHLTRVTDPRGVTTTYDYNAFGDVLAVHSPDAGTTTYSYDKAGNRITQTDARGITATYTYDAANRLTAIDYPGTAEDIAFAYDQGTQGIGRLTTITDASGSTEYRYGPRGNIIRETRTINGTVLTTSYGYDLADNLVQMTYPSGMVVDLTRDAMGRITGVSATIDGVSRTLAANIGYQPFGPIDNFDYGNGLPLQRSFDLAGRLQTQTAGSVQDLVWHYTNTGNIDAITDNRNAGRSQSFGYDALYRLTSATGAYGSKTYSYDAVSNRTELIDNGNTTTYTYATDSNRLQQAVGAASYAANYDATGNTVDDGSIQYTYNNRNRLATAERNNLLIGQYEYNALGQRVKKTVPAQTLPGDGTGDGVIDEQDLLALNAALRPNAARAPNPALDCNGDGRVTRRDTSCIAQQIGGGKGKGKGNTKEVTATAALATEQTTLFAYNQAGQLIGEYQTDGTAIREYVYLQGVPLALVVPDPLNEAQVYYYHTDHLGTPQKLTDAAGAIAWDAIYDPFGEANLQTSQVDQPLRFPGQYFDPETGLHQNYFRDYQPGIGRYVQSDPIGLLGGPNTYLYADANPLRYFDQFGLKTECDDDCDKSYIGCLANCISYYDPLDLGGKAVLTAAGAPVPKEALGLPRGVGGASRYTTLPSAGAHYATGGRAGAGTSGGIVRSAGRAASRLWIAYGVYLFGAEAYCAIACAADSCSY